MISFTWNFGSDMGLESKSLQFSWGRSFLTSTVYRLVELTYGLYSVISFNVCLWHSIYDSAMSKLKIFCSSHTVQPQIKCTSWWMPVRHDVFEKKKKKQKLKQCKRPLSTDTNEKVVLSNSTETSRDFPFQPIPVLKVNACLLNIMIHNTFFTQSWKCGCVVRTTTKEIKWNLDPVYTFTR